MKKILLRKARWDRETRYGKHFKLMRKFWVVVRVLHMTHDEQEDKISSLEKQLKERGKPI